MQIQSLFRMKYFSALFFVLAIACAPSRKLPSEKNLDGNWTLAVFPYQKKTLAEVFGSRVVELRFSKDSSAVTGTTGCNRFRGTYTADAENLTISPNLILTKMACTDYDERLFLNALNRVTKYRQIEGQLELMHNNEIVMIFAKAL